MSATTEEIKYLVDGFKNIFETFESVGTNSKRVQIKIHPDGESCDVDFSFASGNVTYTPTIYINFENPENFDQVRLGVTDIKEKCNRIFDL